MKIILGSDHAGFDLKEGVKEFLIKLGWEVEDCGAHKYDEQDDYPDFIIPAAEKVATLIKKGEHPVFGIVFGGSGQGEAISANKVKGIRAALYYGGDMDIIRLSRQHN